METIKTLLSNKEVSSEMRDERKLREKGEAVKNYINMQHKKISTPTTASRNWSLPYSARRPSSCQSPRRGGPAHASSLGEEAQLMTVPLTDDKDPAHRAWSNDDL
jgi:hypothetical protein